MAGVAAFVDKIRAEPSAKHFLELPSEDDDPDFFEEVKTPISLAEIAANAKAGKYATAEAVQADFALMLTNTRDLDGDDADSERVRDSYELEKAFAALLAAEKADAPAAGEAGAAEGGDGDSKKRKATDEGGAEAEGTAAKKGAGAGDGGAGQSEIDAEELEKQMKKARRETEDEIRGLHRTGGNATTMAERQDCTLHWLRKLMGYKDREFTELR